MRRDIGTNFFIVTGTRGIRLNVMSRFIIESRCNPHLLTHSLPTFSNEDALHMFVYSFATQ